MAAKRKAVAHLKPGTTATHTPTGQRVTVAWESNGPRGLKGPWYWCSFPVAIPGVTETNHDGYHMATVHGSTLNYGGMKRNPFDGSKRQSFQPIKATVVKAGAHNLRVGTKVLVLEIDNARGIAVCSVAGTATAHVPVNCLEVTGGAFMQHMFASNPPLVVFGNPPGKKSRGSKMLSKRAISIRYVHAADGQRYEHKFGANDCIELLADGSFRIYNKSGKNLWKDFL